MPLKFEFLPVEVLELILCNNCIEPEDVISCSRVSRTLKVICNRNSIWRSKFKMIYPTLYLHIPAPDRWKKLYNSISKLRREMTKNILALSHTFVWSMYHDYEWPDIPRRALSLYEVMFDEQTAEGCGKYYVLDECYRLIHGGLKHKNLTLKYYAEKVYIHLNDQCVANSEWEKFIQDSKTTLKHEYEKGLMIIAKSLQPTIRVDEAYVQKRLDLYSWEVKKFLQSKYPNVFVFERNLLRHNNGKKSIWKGEQCVLILEEVHNYFKHSLCFQAIGTFDYDPSNYCVDKVLKKLKGSSKVLLALESCIGKRLGVFTEIHKSKSGRIPDSWKLYYLGSDDKSGYLEDCVLCLEETSPMNLVIDNWKNVQLVDSLELCRTLFHHIVFLAECRLRGEWWQAGEPVVHDLLAEETYNQPIRSLFSSWRHVEHWKISQLRHYRCQLGRVIENPNSIQGKLLHLNILLRINSSLTLHALTDMRRQMVQPPYTLRDLLRMIASVNTRAKARVVDLKMLLNPNGNNHSSLSPLALASGPWPHGWPGGEMVQKRRVDRKSWQVQFAVGQVLEQKGNSLCVVYDWDSMCVESEDTLILMGETNLNHGTDQPFFRVLIDGGASRYLAQENLRHAREPMPITNPLLGRYFTAFVYPHYVPNPQKAYEYPEDANIREQDALFLSLI